MSKRFITVGASLLILLCLGGVYAWSEFVPPLRSVYGYSAAQTQWIFGLTIATFTLSMIGAGRLLYRWGPGKVAAVGGVLFAVGYLLSAFTCHRFIGLLVGIGGIAGAGIGFGYVAPLAMVMASFPGRKGLAGGVAVAGFGGGAILTASLVAALLKRGITLPNLFGSLGLAYGLLVMMASLFLHRPTEGPVGAPPDLHPRRIGQDAYLRKLFLGMFCGTFAGLLLIGNLKPIGLAGGVAEAAATLAISVFAIGNATGRIVWGGLSDRIGFSVVRWSLGFLALVALGLLPAPAHNTLFVIISLLIGFGFGACFSVYASLVAARYGAQHVGGIYPLVFLAYGIAGITGPTIGGYLYDATGTYLSAILVAVAVAVAGVAMGKEPAASAAPPA